MPSTTVIAVVSFHLRHRPEVVYGPVRRSARRWRTKPAATATTTARQHIGGETAATAVARHRRGGGRRPFANGPRDHRLCLSNLVVWHPIDHDHDLAQSDSNYGGGVGAPPAPAAIAVGSAVFGDCCRPET